MKIIITEEQKRFLCEATVEAPPLQSISFEDISFKKTGGQQNLGGENYDVYEVYLNNDMDEYLYKLNEPPFEQGERPAILLNTHLRNRQHFPKGLTKKLRGLGLGKKIKQAIIKELSYVSSQEGDKSPEAAHVWNSLKKNYPIMKIMNLEYMLDPNNLDSALSQIARGYKASYLKMLIPMIESNFSLEKLEDIINQF